METTSKLRDDFANYWKDKIGPLVGWNGIGKAPTKELALLHLKIWNLYRIAVTQEGTIE